LEDLDSLEVLENFKDLIMDLLATKKDWKERGKPDTLETPE
jgi:hypothetical protein